MISPAHPTAFLDSGATFSDDRRYRYLLWRIWESSLPVVSWTLLNPSIADEQVLDPTLKRCMGFSKRWGMGGMYITNLFPLVSTNPMALRTSMNDVAMETNAIHVENACRQSSLTVVGWGSNVEHPLLRDAPVRLYEKVLKVYRPHFLRVGKRGHPAHPLYLPYDCELQDWKP
jgi:hypothetical protein